MILSKLFKKRPPTGGDAPMFVIFGTMRSGSNLLQEKLNYFEDLICLGELFNPKYVGVGRPHINEMVYAGWDRHDKQARDRREEEPLRLLRDVREQAKADGKIPGFRHFNGHNPDVRDALIEAENCKKVLLTRNLIDSFVSLAFASASGQWMRKNDQEQKVKQVEFSVSAYEEYVAKHRKYFTQIRTRIEELGQEYLLLDYQDVLVDEKVAEVAHFVGATKSMMDYEPALQRQRGGTLEEKLSNYAEVAEYIRNCDQSAF